MVIILYLLHISIKFKIMYKNTKIKKSQEYNADKCKMCRCFHKNNL